MHGDSTFVYLKAQLAKCREMDKPSFIATSVLNHWYSKHMLILNILNSPEIGQRPKQFK